MYKVMTKLHTGGNKNVFRFHMVTNDLGQTVEYAVNSLDEAAETALELLRKVGYDDLRIVDDKPYYLDLIYGVKPIPEPNLYTLEMICPKEVSAEPMKIEGIEENETVKVKLTWVGKMTAFHLIIDEKEYKTGLPKWISYEEISNTEGYLIFSGITRDHVIEIEVDEIFVDPGYDYTDYTEISEAEELVEFIKNAPAGEGAKLTTDITIDGVLPLSDSGDTVINLDGHKLTSTAVGATVVSEGESLTLRNGTIELNGGEKVDKVALEVEAGAKLTLKDVKLTVDKSAAIYPSGIGATVVVEDSEITAYGMAICTNASSEAGYNVDVTIKNSKINAMDESGSAGSAFMVNVPCNVRVEGSEINGYFHGAIIRGGNVTFKNSTITNTTTDANYDQLGHYFDDRNWGSGNMVELAALVIGNKSASAYQYPSNVTLVNTKVEAKAAVGSTKTLPTVYMYGNEGEGLGASLFYDRDSSVGEIVTGNKNCTVNGKAVK